MRFWSAFIIIWANKKGLPFENLGCIFPVRSHRAETGKSVDFDSFSGGPKLPIVKDILGTARKAKHQEYHFEGVSGLTYDFS